MPPVNSKSARNPDPNRFHLRPFPYARPSGGTSSSSSSSGLENLESGDLPANVLNDLLNELQFYNETGTATYVLQHFAALEAVVSVRHIFLHSNLFN